MRFQPRPAPRATLDVRPASTSRLASNSYASPPHGYRRFRCFTGAHAAPPQHSNAASRTGRDARPLPAPEARAESPAPRFSENQAQPAPGTRPTVPGDGPAPMLVNRSRPGTSEPGPTASTRRAPSPQRIVDPPVPPKLGRPRPAALAASRKLRSSGNQRPDRCAQSSNPVPGEPAATRN